MTQRNSKRDHGGTKDCPIVAPFVAAIPDEVLSARIKRLPPHHRIAHLRALMRSQPLGAERRERLAALLRAELVAPAGRRGWLS